ncbi:MAG: amidohydrolase [Bacteroidales bacterium]|nr:amidohydrolase [Bacteroidales bacterium]
MNSSQLKYDIWIKNAHILSMDAAFTEFVETNILIKDGKIAHIGSVENLGPINADYLIDASHMILLPPFFNAHNHAAMSLFRGLRNDVPLMTWLQEYIWPAEKKYINAKNVRLGTLLSGIEMIRSGTNLFADMYFFEDEVAQASIELGMRCILGEAILDFPTPNQKTPTEGIHYTRNLYYKYRDESLVSLSISAHAPYTCSTSVLKSISEVSKDLKIPSTIHVSETSREVEESLKTHGKTPVEYLNDLGFFDFHTICYHCIHLSDHDIEILKEKEVSVITLPNSNMQLASGITPIPKLLDSEICLGLGTDGAASNNNMSLLRDMQMMIKLQKLSHLDSTILNAKTALSIATSNGAKSYKMQNSLGSIEIGKSADIQFINIDSPHMQPLYNPYAQIVYSMQESDVKHLLINGRFVMKDRIILNADEEKIIYEAMSFARKLNIG